MKNEGTIERGIQITIAVALFLAGFFWMSGVWQAMIFVAAALIGAFSVIGFCPLYAIIGKNNACPTGGLGRKKVVALIIYGCGILAISSYASMFFTKKLFLEDFNAMNNDYKQTLFETGQSNRNQSQEKYAKLTVSYTAFEEKYAAYHPYVLRGDVLLNDDLKKIGKIIAGVNDEVNDGDLKAAHLELEKVRPITQDILKRNGFSLLSVSLVDFHDAMEKVLDKANAKDASGVAAAYAEASDKLSVVEAEANDNEIKAIRKNLEDIVQLAKNNDLESLPGKAAELKSSFVKVYLQRG